MEKTILITGATSGIGEATAYVLAKAGHRIIITGRRRDRLERLASELNQQFKTKVEYVQFDVQKEEDVISGIQSISEDFRNIDILINNAGLAAGADPIQTGDLKNWERMLNTNVLGLLLVTKHILPFLKSSKTPHIINVGSIAGKEVYPGGNVYCASKHAVEALTRGMRMDLIHEGIKVSQISPGLVETEFSLVRFDGDATKAKNVYKGMQPLKAEDIAASISFIIEQPWHVNIADILILPTQQASSTIVNRDPS